jgi:PKD repeat protein
MTIPKIAVLATGLVAAVLVTTINPTPAMATPRASSCAGCHNPATAGVSTATPSTTTPAPGGTYTVAITLVDAGNGGRTGYGIVPIAPAVEKTFGGGTAALFAYAATMKAPTAAGTYKYTVWTNQGLTDGTAQVGSVVYSITVAAAPVVVTTTTALAVSPASPVVAPADATLTATVSGAGAAGTVEFFNGTTSLGTSAVASGTATKSLTALAAGSYSYTAVFTPTNAALFTSSTSSASAYVVNAAPPVVTAPVAAFTSATTSLTAVMTDTSTGTPTSWSWDLGNGTTSTVQNPSVIYAADGIYTVVLTATNEAGSSSVTHFITVTASTPLPSMAFIRQLSPEEGRVGATVEIEGTGFGTPGVVQFGAVTARVLSWSSN